MDKDKNAPNKNNEDKTLWAYATQDVTPLKDTPESDKNQTPEAYKKQPRAEVKNKAPKQKNETDRKTSQKLKKGQIRIEASLDLHGMSKSQAYACLKSFIHRSYQNNLKCVLVITGKGRPRHGDISLADQKPGVLKTHVPQWLQETEFEPYILKSEWAKPKDGGEGALYVLLRRNK